MLTSEISLWPSGPMVTLGAYFIGWKYVFSLLFLLWAIGLLRWPSRLWLLGGTLLLATVAIVGLALPLERPYGLVEDRAGLFELATPMVAAARGTPAEGWLVAETNPFPLWSFVLAVTSGHDTERLLAFYRWIPALALSFFAFALYGWISTIETEGSSRRWGAPLAVFLAIFLSTDRLGFLREGATLWTETFWLRPRIACAMSLLFSFLWTLGRAEGLRGFLTAAGLLAATAWTEPQIALLGAAGTLGPALARRSGRAVLSLVVAGALFAVWPVPLVSRWPGASGAWTGGLGALYSLTIDRGLIFVLATYGSCRLLGSSRNRSSELFLGLLGTTFALYFVGCWSPAVSQWLDRDLVTRIASFLLASAAGLGLSSLLAGLPPHLDRSLDSRVLALFLVVSLPWCFPYWWHAVRMDETYRQSLVPVSRQRVELAAWIRSNTSSDAVFTAGPTYGPWIGALTGRRLLWVEGAAELSDGRRQAQSSILESRDSVEIRAAVEKWGVTHVAWGRLDADGPFEFHSDFAKKSPMFSEVHSQRRWVVVYEIRP